MPDKIDAFLSGVTRKDVGTISIGAGKTFYITYTKGDSSKCNVRMYNMLSFVCHRTKGMV